MFSATQANDLLDRTPFPNFLNIQAFMASWEPPILKHCEYFRSSIRRFDSVLHPLTYAR